MCHRSSPWRRNGFFGKGPRQFVIADLALADPSGADGGSMLRRKSSYNNGNSNPRHAVGSLATMPLNSSAHGSRGYPFAVLDPTKRSQCYRRPKVCRYRISSRRTGASPCTVTRCRYRPIHWQSRTCRGRQAQKLAPNKGHGPLRARLLRAGMAGSSRQSPPGALDRRPTVHRCPQG